LTVRLPSKSRSCCRWDRIDFGFGVGLERDHHAVAERRRILVERRADINLVVVRAPLAVSDPSAVEEFPFPAQRIEHRIIEFARRFGIVGADGHVTQHVVLPLTRGKFNGFRKTDKEQVGVNWGLRWRWI
jgi:hypothetical protein